MIDENDACGNIVKKQNPKYHKWKKLDKLLMSWLVASISESTFSHIARCSFVHEIWIILENFFTARSKLRVLSLKNMLQTMKKGNLTIHEYLRKKKNVADALIASGHNVTEGELISCILDGIIPEFNPALVHITSKLDECASGLNLGDAKAILQRYQQRMSEHFVYGFDIHGGLVNMASRIVG